MNSIGRCIQLFLFTTMLLSRLYAAGENSTDVETNKVTIAKIQKKVTTGFAIAQGMAELFTQKDFQKSVQATAKSVSLYLGAIGPFIGLLFTLIPTGPSKEELYMKEILKTMKNMMEQIDNNFDNLDKKFKDTERIIEWKSVEVKFGQLEQKILAVSSKYQDLYKVSPDAVENMRKIFIRNYESDYQNSGTKLYNAIVIKHGIFYEDLGSSVLRYTENNCRQTQEFLLGVMQLLLQASKLEIVYYSALNYSNIVDYHKSIWEERFKNVTDNYKMTDEKCRKNYYRQSRKDAIHFAATNNGLSNREFADDLYKILSVKYDWRDWIVFVYNRVSGGFNHYARWCEGHILSNNRRWKRNFHIASIAKFTSSIEKKRQGMEFKRAYNALSYYMHMLIHLRCNWSDFTYIDYGFFTKEYISYKSTAKENIEYSARDMFYTMPYVCNVVALRDNVDLNPQVRNSNNIRFKRVFADELYHAFLWG